MRTYVWTFKATGLLVTVTINPDKDQLLIRADEGSLDVNALWFSDGDTTKEGNTTLKNASLNMNGSASNGIIWDSVAELSAPGLGRDRNLKKTYLTKGEEIAYPLEDLGLKTGDLANYPSLIIGLRATSVNGNGSIKLVDRTPDVISVNKLPTAEGDTNTIAEDDDSVSGNVRGNDTLGDGTEAENYVELNGSGDGRYGVINLNRDGTYIYTLNNDNPLVQSLPQGGELNETYNYTLTDKDGDTSTASLNISITGKDDDASVQTPIANGPDSEVFEAGLPGGSDAGSDLESATNTFTVKASDGIASVTIGGVGFTLQQLQALNGMQTVDTTEGVLKLNSFSGDKFGGSVNYTYTVKAAIDNDTRGDAAGTYFDDSVTITVEGIGGTAATDSLVIRIRDDEPRAFSAANSGQSTALPSNLMLVLDISGSMNEPSGVAGLSRLALMKQSVNKLIDDYDAFGDVMVNIVTFSSQASNPQPNWQAATEAKGFVNSLVASGTTNYDDALNTAWNAFKNDGGRQLGGQNILYFLSDGIPNVNGVPSGTLASPTYGTGINNLGGGNGIDGDEEADWQGFLKNFEIKSYAIGLGTGSVASQLDPIAFDGTAVGTNTNAIVVTDLKDLDATLATTITAPPLVGTLLDGTTATTGADGGWIRSVAINGVTYSWDQSSDQSAVLGQSSGSFNTVTNEWVITTPQQANFTINMETGSYTYAPPVPLTRALNETLTYTVQDNDGDTAASQLSLNVALPSVAPIAVDLGSDGIAYRSVVPGLDVRLPSGLAPTAWVGAQDGLLAYDYNSDGVINQAKEFVFTMWGRNPEVTTDMQALGAYFDSNRDGLLSSLDGSWNQFGVWQDLNSDGVQQEGEFHDLITWGIESIVLSYREGSTPYGAADGQVQVYGQMDVNYANGAASHGVV